MYRMYRMYRMISGIMARSSGSFRSVRSSRKRRIVSREGWIATGITGSRIRRLRSGRNDRIIARHDRISAGIISRIRLRVTGSVNRISDRWIQELTAVAVVTSGLRPKYSSDDSAQQGSDSSGRNQTGNGCFAQVSARGLIEAQQVTGSADDTSGQKSAQDPSQRFGLFPVQRFRFHLHGAQNRPDVLCFRYVSVVCRVDSGEERPEQSIVLAIRHGCIHPD